MCEPPLLNLLLRQDAAPTGPVWRGERAEEGARRVARRRRASSLSAHGCAVSGPPEHAREVGGHGWPETATPGCVSLVTFFAQAKKVTRSPQASGSRALAETNQRARNWIPAFAELTSEKKQIYLLARRRVEAVHFGENVKGQDGFRLLPEWRAVRRKLPAASRGFALRRNNEVQDVFQLAPDLRPSDKQIRRVRQPRVAARSERDPKQ